MNFKQSLLIKSFVCLTVLIRHVLCYAQCNDNGICPHNKPFCSEAGCVFDCPRPFYVNGTNCVSNCGDWFANSQLCVRQCPDTWFTRETPVLIGSHVYIEKRCISSCNTTEYMFEKICVRACPMNLRFVNNQACSHQCSSNMHLQLNFSINSITYHKCVEHCPKFVDNVYCTEKCGDDKLVLNSSCVDQCPESHPLTSGYGCVKTCPDTTVSIENNTCLKNCTKDKPFYLNETCAETCPETFYITNRSGVIFCEYKCQDGEYTYRNTCLNSCADDGKRDYYLYYLNKSCVDECPSNYFRQKNEFYHVGECVASCSKDQFIFNNTCVKHCPAETFVINSLCVNSCPAKFPYKCLIEKGAECNGVDIRPNAASYELCVSSCPTNTFIFNNSCVKKCPISYRASGQKCVLECSKHIPFNQNRTISYNSWKSCYYCYSGWKKTVTTDQIIECVSECREGMVNFNSTCVYECPYNYPYIDNGTCQMDGCKTKYMYNDSSNMICTDLCADEYFIYNDACVKKCPNNVYITNKTCHLDTCQTKYMFNTSSVILCTDDCIKYGFIRNKTCDAQCPYYVFNDTCVLNCPESHSLMTNQTRNVDCDYEQTNCKKTITYTECKSKCPEPLYQYKDLCLDVCPKSHFIFDQTCVAKCPQSHPFHQRLKNNNTNSPDGKDKQVMPEDVNFLNVCVEQCTYPRYLLDKRDFSCLDTCPNLTRYIDSNVCTTGCPKGKLPNEAEQGIECINSCPSKRFLFNKTCVKACPQSTYIFNNSECVFECPNSQPFGLTSGNWRCIKSCKSYELFKTGTCISALKCTEPYFAYENACVKSCPEGYYWSYGCTTRWDKTDITVISVVFGIFFILTVLCRITLKEYFTVILMILFKADVCCKMDIVEGDEGDNENQNEDEHALLIELDESEET